MSSNELEVVSNNSSDTSIGSIENQVSSFTMLNSEELLWDVVGQSAWNISSS